MSKEESNKNLLEEGLGIDGSTFAHSLAFNGQCFLMNAARQLANAPEFIGEISAPAGGSSGDEAALKIIYGDNTTDPGNPIAGRADPYTATTTATDAGSNFTGPGVAPDTAGPAGMAGDFDNNSSTDPTRRGRMQRYQTHGRQQWSPFAPIVPVITQTIRTPVAFTNLAPNREAHQALMDMGPEALAQLVPYIRIYKVEYGYRYDDLDPGIPLPDTSKTQDIEIIFDKFVNDRSFDESGILKTGRLSGVGIKKFRWQLRGVNPAEADRNIEAQLELHFNSVDQVFMTQGGRYKTKVEQGEASVLDLIVMSPPIVGAPPTYDPSSPAAAAPATNHLIYDGHFFEIKAVVGWDVPKTPEIEEILGVKDVQKFADGLKTVLYLQLTDHRFNFNQDGSADLVINYRARTTMKEIEDDVTGQGRKQFLLDRIAKLERANVLPLDPGHAAAGANPDRVILFKANKELESFSTTRYTDLVKKLPKYVAWARPEQLMLFEKSGDQTKETSIKDFWRGTNSGNDPDRFENEGTGVGSSTGEKNEIKNLGIAPPGLGADFMMVHGPSKVEEIEPFFKLDFLEPLDNPWYPVAENFNRTERQSLQGVIEDVIEVGLNPDLSDEDFQKTALVHTNTTIAAGKGTRSDILVGSDNEVDPQRTGHLPVVFFYLGDLLWHLIENTSGVKKQVQKKNLGIMTLNMLLPYPEKIHEQMLKAGLKVNQALARQLKFGWHSLTDAQMKTMLYPLNISTIPIQLDLFLEWLQRKVIKADRDVYFFEDFLIDLIRDLVNPVLGTACLPGVPNFKTSISCVSLTADKTSALAKKLKWNTSKGWTSPSRELPTRITESGALMVQESDLQSAFFNKLSPTINKKKIVPGPGGALVGPITGEEQAHITFKVLLPTEQPIRRSGAPGKDSPDAKNGVWHFKVGDNKGPVLKISFDRTDIPLAREARTNRARTADIWQLRELYNTSIKLVGFPGLLPGQVVYVTPNMHMFGDPRSEGSVARILGLGGYHIIVSTDSEITPGGFTTTIRALHEALPKQKQEDAN